MKKFKIVPIPDSKKTEKVYDYFLQAGYKVRLVRTPEKKDYLVFYHLDFEDLRLLKIDMANKKAVL